MKRMESYLRLLTAVGIVCVVLTASSEASIVPMLITYQAELRSPSTGLPLPDRT